MPGRRFNKSNSICDHLKNFFDVFLPISALPEGFDEIKGCWFENGSSRPFSVLMKIITGAAVLF